MTETICAIATAPCGAIGIVRVSGPEAFPIVSRVCRRITAATPPRTAVLTPIAASYEHPLQIIDEALVTLFPAPHSYTGEDCAEISCHGSRYILNHLLGILVQQGARLANPGEFTQRAFLNGKLDLSQAEAVADLIASTNQATHSVAMSQLRGHFSTELHKLRDQLLHLTSLLELELDFSDHEELEFADRTELLTLSRQTDNRITTLARSFETGQALKQGIPVAIVGKTNVGKSTLLNQLVRDDRAIVSNIHGTTRDTIEDSIDIRGVTFRFIDTAGIRPTTDTVEQIGINRTYAAIDRARIVLWLFDTPPTAEEIKDMKARTQGKAMIPILNKIDATATALSTPGKPSPVDGDISAVAPPLPDSSIIKISAKFGTNLEALEERIFSAADLHTQTDSDIIITSARHYEALNRAHDALQRVISGLTTNTPSDLIAEDLHLTITHLADITGGAITPQETLNNIFSHFCVGK